VGNRTYFCDKHYRAVSKHFKYLRDARNFRHPTS
jgi:hypothetical protein